MDPALVVETDLQILTPRVAAVRPAASAHLGVVRVVDGARPNVLDAGGPGACRIAPEQFVEYSRREAQASLAAGDFRLCGTQRNEGIAVERRAAAARAEHESAVTHECGEDVGGRPLALAAELGVAGRTMADGDALPGIVGGQIVDALAGRVALVAVVPGLELNPRHVRAAAALTREIHVDASRQTHGAEA
ncbi:hypothetical protein [Nannocystis sp. SCPEA4]|uniref:hypothetical protein n=1 Tax=Nannocystis sp. SCPEA4 TaxID=2996787 RepID=UPI00226E134D|nr:hypothetical protein [Nannocystis sp. SCPEA4]MCY1060835.1 hypothetical protein [Nannocystis sp. SCPEA4]